jgi:hypothetical protein
MLQEPEDSRSGVAKDSQYTYTASPLGALALKPSGSCSIQEDSRSGVAKDSQYTYTASPLGAFLLSKDNKIIAEK